MLVDGKQSYQDEHFNVIYLLFKFDAVGAEEYIIEPDLTWYKQLIDCHCTYK